MSIVFGPEELILLKTYECGVVIYHHAYRGQTCRFSPVAKDSDTNTITETSGIISIEIQDIEGIRPKTQIWILLLHTSPFLGLIALRGPMMCIAP